MEWVETTAKTLEAAREAALDRLGVGADEAEFDIVEEPKPGLFGRTRGQARIRARVRPTPVRPKQERRRRGKSDKGKSDKTTSEKGSSDKAASDQAASDTGGSDDTADRGRDEQPTARRRGRANGRAASASEATATETAPTSDDDTAAPRRSRGASTSSSNDRSRGSRRGSSNKQEQDMNHEDRPESTVTPQEVGDAAVAFMNDLTVAFGASGTAELTIDGTELDVQVHGEDLGLLVGPGGRTLNAIQDLVRVSAQRRLGDHETRLRIDVAGYRERRSAALAKFAADVAQQVRESGTARSLEPMTSADRKVIHDALNEEEGVQSTSSGDDPYRRVIVQPA